MKRLAVIVILVLILTLCVTACAQAPTTPNAKRIAELQAESQRIIVEKAQRLEIIQQHQAAIANLDAKLQQNVGAIGELQRQDAETAKAKSEQPKDK